MSSIISSPTQKENVVMANEMRGCQSPQKRQKRRTRKRSLSQESPSISQPSSPAKRQRQCDGITADDRNAHNAEGETIRTESTTAAPYVPLTSPTEESPKKLRSYVHSFAEVKRNQMMAANTTPLRCPQAGTPHPRVEMEGADPYRKASVLDSAIDDAGGVKIAHTPRVARDEMNDARGKQPIISPLGVWQVAESVFDWKKCGDRHGHWYLKEGGFQDDVRPPSTMNANVVTKATGMMGRRTPAITATSSHLMPHSNPLPLSSVINRTCAPLPVSPQPPPYPPWDALAVSKILAGNEIMARHRATLYVKRLMRAVGEGDTSAFSSAKRDDTDDRGRRTCGGISIASVLIGMDELIGFFWRVLEEGPRNATYNDWGEGSPAVAEVAGDDVGLSGERREGDSAEADYYDRSIVCERDEGVPLRQDIDDPGETACRAVENCTDKEFMEDDAASQNGSLHGPFSLDANCIAQSFPRHTHDRKSERRRLAFFFCPVSTRSLIFFFLALVLIAAPLIEFVRLWLRCNVHEMRRGFFAGGLLNELNQTEQKLRSLHNQNKQYAVQVENMERKLRIIHSTKKDVEEELRMAQSMALQLEGTHRATEEELERTKFQLDVVVSGKQDTLRALTRAWDRIDNLTQSNENAMKDLVACQGQLQRLSLEKSALNSELTATADEICQVETRLASAENKLYHARMQTLEMTQERQRYEQLIRDLMTKMGDMEEEMTSLKLQLEHQAMEAIQALNAVGMAAAKQKRGDFNKPGQKGNGNLIDSQVPGIVETTNAVRFNAITIPYRINTSDHGERELAAEKRMKSLVAAIHALEDRKSGGERSLEDDLC